MRRRWIIAASAALLMAFGPAGDLTTDLTTNLTTDASAKSRSGCNSQACELRVLKRVTYAKWRVAARAYGLGLLRARMRCESGGDGGYGLATTGNRYWFAHQFNVDAWTGAGGRFRGGRPVGVWTKQPTRIEQDYRAVRWHRIHGGDPWPRCP